MSCVCVWGREEDEWWEMMHGMLHGEVRVSASPRVRVSPCLRHAGHDVSCERQFDNEFSAEEYGQEAKDRHS